MSKRPKTAIVQLKVRLDEPLRAKLDRSAKARQPRRISLNAEIVNRIEQSFDADEANRTTKKLLADAKAVIAGERDAAMRQWGFSQVVGRPGHWIENDKIDQQEMVALNPALENLIEHVVNRTLQKAKQS